MTFHKVAQSNMLLMLILTPLLGALFVWCCAHTAVVNKPHNDFKMSFALKSAGDLVLQQSPSEAVAQPTASFSRKASFFVTLLTLFLSLAIWLAYDATSGQMFQLVGAGHYLGIDGISLWMILLTTVLFPICILCSKAELCYLLLILESVLLASWCVLDLLIFYVLYESILIPMFLLICLGGPGQRKVKAAYQLVFYTLIGSLAWLPCVLLIYSLAGTTHLELLYNLRHSMHLIVSDQASQFMQPVDQQFVTTSFLTFDQQRLLWWGFFLALAVKIPVVPIHLWLPEAHVEAPTAGSVLLAGVVLKLGTYGFLRFCLPLLPDACSYYSPLVLTLGLISLIYASLTTLRQVDLKKVIAYSSIAHMNMANMAIFTLHHQSMLASLFMMLSHGVVSPALFLCVSVVYDRFHSKLFRYLSGGAAITMPLFSIFFFIFSLANMALPLSPNFLSEFAILCGLFSSHVMATLLATFSMVLAAAYTLWAYARLVHGMPNSHYMINSTDLNRLEFWCLFPLLVCTLWLGLKPSLVLDSMTHSVLFLHELSQVCV